MTKKNAAKNTTKATSSEPQSTPLVSFDFSKPNRISNPAFRSALVEKIVCEFTTHLKKEEINKSLIEQELNFLVQFDPTCAAWIKKEYNESSPNLNVEFSIPSITLNKIKLGRFKFISKLQINKNYDNKFQGSVLFVAKALDPNPSKYFPSCTHPNVRGESVCLGDVSVSVKNAIRSFRYSDAAEMINIVLNNYSSSPYTRIKDWNGKKCKNCEDVKTFVNDENEDDLGCNSCRKDSCNKCLVQCKCGEQNHEGCLNKCFTCKKVICNQCKVKRGKPVQYYCDKCMQNCTKCYKVFPYKELDLNHRCKKCATLYITCKGGCKKLIDKTQLINGYCWSCVDNRRANERRNTPLVIPSSLRIY